MSAPGWRATSRSTTSGRRPAAGRYCRRRARHRAADDGLRRVIAAHRVNRDAKHAVSGRLHRLSTVSNGVTGPLLEPDSRDRDGQVSAENCWLGATPRRRPHLTAVVVAAVRAHLVGCLASWHCGHRPAGTVFSASWVRRLAVRVFECRRLGLGILILLRSGQQTLERRQPGILPRRCALAFLSIQVRAALGHRPRHASLHSGFIGSAS